MPDLTIKPPKAIIIVGASRDRAKYGNKAVRAYQEVGTKVLAINPFAKEIEGAKVFSRVADLPPGESELASIYTQPRVTDKLLPALAAYGVKKIFFNPGSDTKELVEKTKELKMEPILACSVTAIGKDPDKF